LTFVFAFDISVSAYRLHTIQLAKLGRSMLRPYSEKP
jgi:hypothetical protein